MLENIIRNAEFERNQIIYAALTGRKETFSRWRIGKHNFDRYSLKYNCRSYLHINRKNRTLNTRTSDMQRRRKKFS